MRRETATVRIFEIYLVVISWLASYLFASRETATTSDAVVWFGFCLILLLALAAAPLGLLTIAPLRRRIFPQAALEGWWFQYVGYKERPWSISRLKFHLPCRWHYEGAAYGEDDTCAAAWESGDIYYDPNTGGWLFKGRSSRMDESGRPTAGGNVLSVLYWGQYQRRRDSEERTCLPIRIIDLDFADRTSAANADLYRIKPYMWEAAGVKNKRIDIDHQAKFRALRNEVDKLKSKL